jgi:hypothetical protein
MAIKVASVRLCTPKLGEYVAQMNFDGIDTEEQLTGDLFVAQARRQQLRSPVRAR